MSCKHRDALDNPPKKVGDERAEAKWNADASATCELEINTDMSAIICTRCGCDIPKGTNLLKLERCPNCHAKVVD